MQSKESEDTGTLRAFLPNTQGRALAVAGHLLLWAGPAIAYFILYWSIARQDNGMLRLQGDTTAVFRDMCLAMSDPRMLFDSHADHLIVSLNILTIPLIKFFGTSYEPYAVVLMASYGLAASAIGTVIFRFTGSIAATAMVVCLFVFGWWSSRATLSNYTEIVSALVLIFICIALLQFRNSADRRSLVQIAVISGMSLAAFLTVGPGVFAFGMVGGTAAFAWLCSQTRAIRLKSRPWIVYPDWRLALGVFAAFGLALAAYSYGETLGNPPLGSVDVGGGTQTEAPLLDRLLTLMRTSVVNIFMPNLVADGSPTDYAIMLGEVHRSMIWPALAIFSAVLGTGIFVFLRGAKANSQFEADLGALILASLAMFVVSSLLSVMGRPTLGLNATRYIIFPLSFFLIAFGLAAGWAIGQLRRPVIARVPPVVVAVATAILCFNHQQFFDTQVQDTVKLRNYLITLDRPEYPWWEACS